MPYALNFWDNFISFDFHIDKIIFGDKNVCQRSISWILTVMLL